ncbi:MAG: DUF4405 domain-containing protein [Candidatus Diapherotrites archaeon]
MDRLKLNFAIDALMLVFFIFSTVTALIIFVFMPPGPRSGRLEFMGIPKLDWTQWHVLLGLVFIALMAFHIILHLNWFACTFNGFFKKSREKCDK